MIFRSNRRRNMDIRYVFLFNLVFQTSQAQWETFCEETGATSISPVGVRVRTTARVSCGLTPVYDEVMWVKCNPGSPTPALAVRRDDVLIDNYREGKAKVLRNGSLVLPYVQPSDAGEYRCYDMSISPSRGPFMVDLSINGSGKSNLPGIWPALVGALVAIGISGLI